MKFPSEEAKWVWLACALDGEGSLRLYRDNRRKTWRVFMEIFNTNLDFLKVAKEIIEHGSLIKRKPSKIGRKPKYGFQTNSAERLREILPKLLPYLTIKVERCKLMIEALKLKEGLQYTGKGCPRLWEIYKIQKSLP